MAFTRTGGLAVVVPRLVAGLDGGWDGTTVALPDGAWVDVLTGERVARGPAAAEPPAPSRERAQRHGR